MGNAPSASFDLQQYHYIDSIIDPLTGDGKLYQNNETGETVCVIERVVQDKRKLCQRYEHPNLLKVYHYQIQTIQELCSTFNKLTVVYEYTNLCIINHVKHRIKKQMPFTQKQLWGLLQQFLDVLSYMKDQGVHPMDLKNSMISNQGRIKLNSLKQVSNYQQLLHNCTDEVHISPEELFCLRNKQYSLNLDFEKCQIFQLGLLCLYCASLEETNNIFDMNSYTYSQNELKRRISQLNYSDQYKNLLFQMLQHAPDQRGTLYSLLGQIQDYQVENNFLQLKKDTSINISEQVLKSNVPLSNKLHILTPDQSRIQEVKIQSELNIYQESKPTLNTQQDENFEIDFTKRQNYYSEQQEIKMPTLSYNFQVNPLKKLQQQQILQKTNYPQQNREILQFGKQSIMSQGSNKSEIENRVEQALKSSKMALQKFDQTISSAQKTRQLY